MTHLAFYRGRTDNLWHRAQDTVIRATTRSVYSHVELVLAHNAPRPGSSAECISASGRDGGVRRKCITFKPDNWEFVSLPWVDYADATARAARHCGEGYDYGAIFLSHVLRVNVQSSSRWICSEFVAYVLRFERPHTFSPGDLFYVVKRVNEVYTRATS